MNERILWNQVETFFLEKFEVEKGAPIETYLFLIGVQEMGTGQQKYTKDDKINLLHIAVCRLLIPFGYYRFSHNDAEGYPHFESVKPLPVLAPNEQSLLMRKAIVQYFLDEGILSEVN